MSSRPRLAINRTQDIRLRRIGLSTLSFPLSADYNSRLHQFAVFTAASTLFLLLAGALVTSNDAGLAVPDWPLSFGSLMPPMVGGIFYEHGHRMVATFVGMLTIGLAAWLWRSKQRRWMRRLGFAALGLVVVQGVLGGITVLFYLPAAVSVAHAFTAQLFFATVVSLAVFTSRWWHTTDALLPQASHSPLAIPYNLHILSAGVVGSIFVQLILGAAYRHKVMGILPHAVWAGVVALLIGWTAHTVSSAGGGQVRVLRRWVRILSALFGVQVLLGLGAWWAIVATRDFPQPMPVMVWTSVAHVVMGAATLATAVILMLCCFRLFPTAHEVRISSAAADEFRVLKTVPREQAQ